MGYKTQKCRH